MIANTFEEVGRDRGGEIAFIYTHPHAGRGLNRSTNRAEGPEATEEVAGY